MLDQWSRTPTAYTGSAPTLSLSKAPVKYYFIDFGISTRFAPQLSRLVVGTPGLDQEPPELSDNVPYDPFKLDVFLIGNLIRRGLPAVSLDGYRRPNIILADFFRQLYSNLTMLEPIMNQMVHRDPARRPTAADAHQQFKAIRRSVPTLSQYWLLQPRNSFIVVKAARGVYSLVSSNLAKLLYPELMVSVSLMPFFGPCFERMVRACLLFFLPSSLLCDLVLSAVALHRRHKPRASQKVFTRTSS